MKSIQRFILLFFLLSSCQTGPSVKEQKQALEKKVMDIHDEAMSKMDLAYQWRMNLQQLNQKLIQQPTDSTTTHLFNNQISVLNQAEESMMDWMHQYKAPNNVPHQQAIFYLQNQLAKINQVKTGIESALQRAQTTYQKYEKN